MWQQALSTSDSLVGTIVGARPKWSWNLLREGDQLKRSESRVTRTRSLFFQRWPCEGAGAIRCAACSPRGEPAPEPHAAGVRRASSAPAPLRRAAGAAPLGPPPTPLRVTWPPGGPHRCDLVRDLAVLDLYVTSPRPRVFHIFVDCPLGIPTGAEATPPAALLLPERYRVTLCPVCAFRVAGPRPWRSRCSAPAF
jgi:hypothetical protein